MKLLYVHNAYAKPSGEEHAALGIGKLMVQHGHEVDWFWRSSADIHGVAGQIMAFFSGIHSVKSARDMEATLKSKAYDLVQVQNLYPLLSPSVLRACKRAEKPVVMRCPNYRLFCPTGLHLSHGSICEKCLGGREWWCFLKNCDIGNNRLRSLSYSVRAMSARMTGAIVNSVDRFVVLTQFQKSRFINGGIDPSRIDIIPNMCDSPPMAPPESTGDLVLYVGRVSPEKGIEDLVLAAEQLPELPFVVAGDWDAMPSLVARSPKNVKWLGFQNEQQLNSLYSNARLLLFPSRCFEGFPNVIPRAMLSHRPVIAARIGGLPEIVAHEQTGMLYDPGNISELVMALHDLYFNIDKCRSLGETGAAMAATEYSPDRIYQLWHDVYARVTM